MKHFTRNLFRYLKCSLSRLTPRRRKVWLFGSAHSYADNTKYLFQYYNKYHKEIRSIWIANSSEELILLRESGCEAYLKKSVKTKLLTYFSKVFIYSSGVRDINMCAAQGAYKVNLWHGVGIKNIEFKIKVGPLAAQYADDTLLNRLNHLNNFTYPDLMLSTSPLMTELFSECFRTSPSNCYEALYPRCEQLLLSKEEVQAGIEKHESSQMLQFVNELKQYDKVYIYMPTWRDANRDFMEKEHFDFASLDVVMKSQNGLFIFKMHPLADIKADNFVNYTSLLLLDSKYDIYPILPFTDVLITDYSSIYYDYLLMKDKSTILFPFDYEEYVTSSRDFAYPFDECTYGEKSYSFEDLLNRLERQDFVSNSEEGAERIAQLFWGDRNRGSKEIVAEIKRRIKL